MKQLATILASVWTYRTVRIALAVAFLAAAGLKLADVHAFVLTIKAFAILPTDSVKPAAYGLLALEILGGGLLLCNVRGGLAIIGFLLFLFIGVIVNAIRQGLDIDCGCYGPGDIEGEVYHGLWPTLWRDGAMLAGVAYCFLWQRLHSRSARPKPPTCKECSCAPSN